MYPPETTMASNNSRKSSRSSRSSRKESPGLQELLVKELQEIHSAENQLARLIPRLTKAAQSETLQAAIQERMEEGEQIIEDVTSALEELEATPGRKKNVAAEGLVNDMREHVQELEEGPALDTVMIAALQKTEHYCIAAWGTVKAMGAAVGQDDLVSAMDRALEEGRAYDERLTQLALEEITPALMAEASGEEEEGEEEESEDEEIEAQAQPRKSRGNRMGAGDRAR